LTGGIEKTHEKIVMIASVPVEIRIGGLLNTSIMLYLKTNLLVGQTLKQRGGIKGKFKRTWFVRNEKSTGNRDETVQTEKLRLQLKLMNKNE
jgi:hypothetical protein